ncbi:hypothetical protein APU90_07015 [Rathayibacter toxicus]|uniref:Uncharacterized protein n=1 Tax=Rathayibacter toxicus TaxID=145458 RepID=A0A0C5BU37_9MICO|nr:hypothetical protein TI83_10050 [Rathayibacter toxicus]ALS57550.1 hypothetical protein APU90_07015 [Rathayibacter toxicus]KKM44911.1 hypothetical protein VT73_07175 [Rathayibacter toxicus]
MLHKGSTEARRAYTPVGMDTSIDQKDRDLLGKTLLQLGIFEEGNLLEGHRHSRGVKFSKNLLYDRSGIVTQMTAGLSYESQPNVHHSAIVWEAAQPAGPTAPRALYRLP